MRDAIVYSGSSWETFNVPERISLALVRLGARVLHCESPVSFFRKRPDAREAEDGISILRPPFVSDRLNRVPVLRSLQSRLLASQICGKAESLKLRDPFFFYPWLGTRLSLLSYLRRKFTLIHIQMDYGEPDAEHHVGPSDVTLTIPFSVYHQQRAKHGGKIHLIPQVVEIKHFETIDGHPLPVSPALESIPHPRLGYLGPAHDQINRPLVADILRRHPEWHFVSIGSEKPFPFHNAHALPWVSNLELPKYAVGFDLGFMPYDCYKEDKLHCLPLKLFEYFALGLPVVATPIIELWQFKDLIYLGDTAEELAIAVTEALNEPPDSPKRKRRRDVARNHSIEDLADALARALPTMKG